MSVYHVALAGRVQRYSPIYYPDSHANSAIVPAGLRPTERPPCHTVAARVVVFTHTPPRGHAHSAARPRTDTFRHPPTGIQRVSPHSRPAWQGFQGALHPRYTVLYDRTRQEKITLRRAAFDRDEGPRARPRAVNRFILERLPIAALAALIPENAAR